MSLNSALDSDLAHAVPVNYAINARRTASSSSIVAGESDFEARLQDRDVGCAFTHRELRYCDAAHIVPHARHPDVRAINLIRLLMTNLDFSGSTG